VVVFSGNQESRNQVVLPRTQYCWARLFKAGSTLEQLDCSLAIVITNSQPDDELVATGVKLAHQSDLLKALDKVILIDTNGVDPKHRAVAPSSPILAMLTQEGFEVGHHR
jgi:hypothetical protein